MVVTVHLIGLRLLTGLLVGAALSQAQPTVPPNRGPADVPALIGIISNPTDLATPGSMQAGGLVMWTISDPRIDAANALAEIGDVAAVPALEQALKTADANAVRGIGGSPARVFAYALYMLTGNSYLYQDGKVIRLFKPEPLTEEKWRARTRPDLNPVAGLTANLKIDAPQQWVASKGLRLTVTIVNRSTSPVRLELSSQMFTFSTVNASGVRAVTPAALLGKTPGELVTLPPGGSVVRNWRIEKLGKSPLSAGWPTGGVHVRCEYNAQAHSTSSNSTAPMWPGTKLVSNSIGGFFFARQ